MTAYDKLCERFRRISTLQDARGILNWDMLTMMPKGAAESRGEQLATLEALAVLGTALTPTPLATAACH